MVTRDKDALKGELETKSPLADPVFWKLFSAQTIALIGTGLAKVGLGLLAFDLAGRDAGKISGTALAIKMVAYVGLSPLSGAVSTRLPTTVMMVGLDLARAVHRTDALRQRGMKESILEATKSWKGNAAANPSALSSGGREWKKP